MAGGLVRVVVLLCAVVAVTRAQFPSGVWHNHGRPTAPLTWIRTAMAPLTHFYGKKWFGVGQNGRLYERYETTPGGTWSWVDHGRPSIFFPNRLFNAEPCAFEGIDRLHATTNTGHLYQRRWAPPWTTNSHGKPGFVSVSGCSAVHRPELRARTFLRGSDGKLYERYCINIPCAGAGTWLWRNHGVPSSSTTLRLNTKTTSYIAAAPTALIAAQHWSHVYVVGTDGNVWRRRTHQNGWGFWSNYGKPLGKTFWKVHASFAGGVWGITSDGLVCMRRLWAWWACFGLTNRRIWDCSDPFTVSQIGQFSSIAGKSVFCISHPSIFPFPSGSSGYGLHQLKLGDSPPNTSPLYAWTNHGLPRMLGSSYFFIDRPNVAFDSGNNVESAFVTSTRGVWELRF